jgi:putative membrane protein insertion efficiency factor
MSAVAADGLRMGGRVDSGGGLGARGASDVAGSDGSDVAGSDRGGAVASMVGLGRWLGRTVVRTPSQALVGLLWVYQRFVSPLTPPSCRYYPSCSQYAVIAIRRHGAVFGGWLTVRRLARCHPWALGGVDDVPATRGGRRHLGLQHVNGARSSTR